MTKQKNNLNAEILDSIPDWLDTRVATEWLAAGKKKFTEKTLLTDAAPIFLEWREIQEDSQKNDGSPFGLYSSMKWRKFVLAGFLADLVSYPIPVDQVNFERLLFVMHAFPNGFRIGWRRTSDGQWWPAGYTAWYPMLETSFASFEKAPEKLKDRMVVPNLHVPTHGAYFYLFNYSVAAIFKKTEFSRELIKKYAADIHAQDPRGLAAICVSDEGIKVAKTFGMSSRGFLNLEGYLEEVYTISNDRQMAKGQ